MHFSGFSRIGKLCTQRNFRETERKFRVTRGEIHSGTHKLFSTHSNNFIFVLSLQSIFLNYFFQFCGVTFNIVQFGNMRTLVGMCIPGKRTCLGFRKYILFVYQCAFMLSNFLERPFSPEFVWCSNMIFLLTFSEVYMSRFKS